MASMLRTWLSDCACCLNAFSSRYCLEQAVQYNRRRPRPLNFVGLEGLWIC